MRISNAFGPTSNVQARRPVLTTLSPNLGCCLPVKTVPAGVMPTTTSPGSHWSPARFFSSGAVGVAVTVTVAVGVGVAPAAAAAAAGLTVAAALRTWAVDFLWSEPEQAHATRPMRVMPPART